MNTRIFNAVFGKQTCPKCVSGPCRCPDYLVDSALRYDRFQSNQELQKATGLDGKTVKRELDRLGKLVETKGKSYRIAT